MAETAVDRMDDRERFEHRLTATRGRPVGDPRLYEQPEQGDDMSTEAEWKVAPIDGGVSSGCLNCGGRPSVHPLDGMLGVGFGMCEVTRDDETVWFEDPNSDDDPPTLQRFEGMAREDPDHDWRVSYDAPMWSGTWQRHGEGEWVLIERGMGFA